MTDPFAGLDPSRPYHRPNSRGQTVKLQARVPQDIDRAMQIIKESGVYGHETKTDTILHCLHIGVTYAANAISSQLPSVKKMAAIMGVMADSDALIVEKEATSKALQKLQEDFYKAAEPGAKQAVLTRVRSLAPWLSDEDRAYLARNLGLEELSGLRVVGDM